jgi:hypothetical protein
VGSSLWRLPPTWYLILNCDYKTKRLTQWEQFRSHQSEFRIFGKSSLLRLTAGNGEYG